MTAHVRIALDAMGGDHGPSVIVPGSALALERRPETRFLIYGREEEVRPHLDAHPRVRAAAELHHCEVSVRMDDKPSAALRKGRWKSSMWRAVEAVKAGQADIAVSAGNTGALMAMSTFCLRTLAGVERPAIAAIWPTSRGESVVLDVGATIGAEARHLVDLALMGAGMARVVLGVPRPKVGLLNVGTEEVKGLEQVREAGRLLREAAFPELEYLGFVEGSDLGRGTADVVVTEGFAGNIALKTAEGTARQVAGYLRAAMGASWRSKLGYLLAKPAFDALRDKLDPRKINGGVFLGLDGLVVKSHGGTDAVGFAAAVDLAHELARGDLLASLRGSLNRPLLRAPLPETAA